MPLSEEHRANIAAALRGRKLPPERVAAAAAGHRGKPLSAEHRAKISAASRASWERPEYRAKISSAARGKGHTPETRAKLAELGRNPKVIGECVYCFGAATTLDHVSPRRHGRRPCTPDCDRVPACALCNDSKAKRTPAEWLEAGLYAGSPPRPKTTAKRSGCV